MSENSEVDNEDNQDSDIEKYQKQRLKLEEREYAEEQRERKEKTNALNKIKNWITKPVDEKRPYEILIYFGILVWFIDIFFYALNQNFWVHYIPMHILMFFVALAVMTPRTGWKISLFIFILYTLIAIGSPTVKNNFESIVTANTKETGDFLFNLFMTPIPYPLWALYGLSKARQYSRPARLLYNLYWIIIIGLTIFSLLETNMYAEASVNFASVAGSGSVAPSTLTESARDLIESVPKRWLGIKKEIELERKRALEYATSGYYEGRVEENANKELGVFIEQIKPAGTTFFDYEDIILWATLKARTLEEKNPVPINLSCIAVLPTTSEDNYEEEEVIEGEIIPEKLAEDGITIQNYEEIDIGCKFSNDKVKKLGAGFHEIRFIAVFDNFLTQAYLKTYFMDKDKKRAMLKEGIDIFKQFGITDTAPIAQYTNGPVKIGAETTKSLPIAIDENILPRLGLTIENQWQGAIKKINSIIIRTPEGVELTHCPVLAPEKVNSLGLTLNEYKVDLRHKSLAEHIEDIETYFSLNCIMSRLDYKNLIDTTPISTRYIQFDARYSYEVMTTLNVEVRESKTEEDIETDEVLELSVNDFGANMRNINKLATYIEELIAVNEKCLDEDVLGARELINNLKLSNEEKKSALKNNLEFCVISANPEGNKARFSQEVIDIIIWSAENIFAEISEARVNINGFRESEFDSKRDELNSAIEDSKIIIAKAIAHINKIKSNKIEFPEIDSNRDKLIKILQDLNP